MRVVLLFLLLADIIHLKSGGKIEGKVVGEKDGKVELKLRDGTTFVPRDQIARIEYADTPEEILEKRRKGLAKDDAKGRYDLALYALQNKYPDEAISLLREAAALKHQEAPRKLREVVEPLADGLWRAAAKEKGERALQLYAEIGDKYPEASIAGKAWVAAGDAAWALGKRVLAEAHYRRAPLAMGRDGLVRCAIAAREWKEAAGLLEDPERRKKLERLAELEKTRARSLELSRLYCEFGAEDLAVDMLEGWDAAEARRELFVLYSKRGDFTRAREVAEKLGDRGLLRLVGFRERYAGELEVRDLAMADRLEKLEAKVNDALAGKKIEFDEPFVEIEAAVRRGESPATYPPAENKPGDRRKGGITRRIKSEFDGKEFEYQLYVPKSYTHEKRWRLLITLHGSNGDPRDQIAGWLDEVQVEKDMILAAPAAGHGCWGNARQGHGLVLSTLYDVMKNYRIDPNRVFLDGSSMGGYGAFYLAAHYPHLWAAIGPRVGQPKVVNVMALGPKKLTPIPEYIESLFNVPIYWIAGEIDPKVSIEEVRIARKKLEELGADVTYREKKGGGHDWFGEEDAKVMDFYRGRVRNPYPKRVLWSSVDPAFARGHWVEATGTTGRLVVQVRHLDNDGKVIDERKEYAEPFTMDVQVEGQIIRVRTKNVTSFTLHLSDRLVDLDREVEIVVNGKPSYKKRVARSVEGLLERCRKDRDREMIFSASVSLKVE